MRKCVLAALAAALTLTSVTAFAPSANACGFIACIADRVIPGSGPVLDGIHEGLGKPLERPIGAPAAPAPIAAPPVLPMPPVALGNRCATPAGVFGPGPLNPVGAPCQAMTPFGLQVGQVI